MKNTIYILIFLVLSTGTLFSQNGKVWEFESNVDVRDVSFIDDSKYIELTESNFESFIAIIDLFNNFNVVNSKVLEFKAIWDLEVSSDEELIFLASSDKIYYYDFNLNLVDSLKVEKYEIQNNDNESIIEKIAINPEYNQLTLIQSKLKNNGYTHYRRLLVYNYLDKKLIKTIEEPSYIDIKYSPENKYLGALNSRVTLYDAENFEYIGTYKNFEGGQGGVIQFSFSNDEKFICLIFEHYSQYSIVVYDIETQEPVIKKRLWNDGLAKIKESKFVDNKFILLTGLDGGDSDANQIAKVYSFPEMEEIHHYEPEMGLYNLTYNTNNNLFLSHSENIISLARFDPNYTSVQSSTNEANYKFYPNPVIDKATLEFEMDKAGQYSYYISDNTGRVIKQFDKEYFDSGTNRLNIDLSSFQIGVYYLHFNPAVGKVFKVIKVE